MNQYKVTYNAAGSDLAVVEEIKLPSEVSEITMLEWCRYRAIPVPEHLADIVTGEKGVIGFEEWCNISSYASSVLQVFSVSEAAILGSDYEIDVEETDGFLAMFIGVISVLTNYKEKLRRRFEHKGLLYEFPEVVQQSFGQSLVGGKMKLGMAADALQLEHVLSQKDVDGQFVLEDQLYWKDISVVAAISRRVYDNGRVEKISLDWVKRRQWLDKRTKEFETLPMDIALDGCFFLSNLKSKLVVTLSSALRLRSSLQIQLSKEQSKQTHTSGSFGTGTQ